MIRDPGIGSIYLMINALDEFRTDVDGLLDFASRKYGAQSCVNDGHLSTWPEIESPLRKVNYKTPLSLEMNAEFISEAVALFKNYKVDKLAQEHGV